MKCVSCEGTTIKHDDACPLHPDKVEEGDQRMLSGPVTMREKLEVRRTRALEHIALMLGAGVEVLEQIDQTLSSQLPAGTGDE